MSFLCTWCCPCACSAWAQASSLCAQKTCPTYLIRKFIVAALSATWLICQIKKKISILKSIRSAKMWSAFWEPCAKRTKKAQISWQLGFFKISAQRTNQSDLAQYRLTQAARDDKSVYREKNAYSSVRYVINTVTRSLCQTKRHFKTKQERRRSCLSLSLFQVSAGETKTSSQRAAPAVQETLRSSSGMTRKHRLVNTLNRILNSEFE